MFRIKVEFKIPFFLCISLWRRRLIPIYFAVFSLLICTHPLWAQSPCEVQENQKDRLVFQLQQCQHQHQSIDHQLRSLQKEHKEALIHLGRAPFTPRFLKHFKTQGSSSLSRFKMKLPRKKIKFLKSSSSRVQSRSLAQFAEGKVVLFAFWATWCKPCVSPEEQKHLRSLEAKLKPYKIPLVSVGIDHWKKIKSQRSKWFYPLWFFKDAHFDWVPEVILKKVGMGLPLFVLRTPKGQVQWILTQTLQDESVEEWLTVALRTKLLN